MGTTALAENLETMDEDRSNLEHKNPSGLEPVGRAVLIKPYEVELKSGVIAIPDHVRKSMDVAEQRAIVMEIGDAAWNDEPYPRAYVGEHVLVTKYAGFQAVGPLDGESYRLINDRDIFCRIAPEGVEDAS